MIELNLKTDTRQANWRRANAEKDRCHLAVDPCCRSGERIVERNWTGGAA